MNFMMRNRKLFSALCIAFSTYSRIPVPQVDWTDENKRYSLCFFPVIGVCVGIALGIWLMLCDALAFGPMLRGAVGAAIPLLVTGGIHMDGFMDTQDAVHSWQPIERRFEILHDPHTGAFAVMSCAAYLLVMAGLLGEMGAGDALALGACFTLSRALSALLLIGLPKASKDGLLAGFAASAEKHVVTMVCAIIAAVCVGLCVAALGVMGLFVPLAAGVCVLIYRRMALRYFGGVTGDLAGWFLQVTELACVAAVLLAARIVRS